MKMFMYVAMLGILLCVPAAAQPQVNYLGGLGEMPVIEHGLGCCCPIGNLGQPASILEDAETYSLYNALTFDPNLFGCGCAVGFEIHNIHLVMAKLDDVPRTIGLQVGLGDAPLLPEEPGPCYEPNICSNWELPVQCWTPYATVSVAAAGYYEFVFPFTCECVFLNYAHSIFFYGSTFLYDAGMRYVLDSSPDHCPDYIWGEGLMGRCHWYPFEADGNYMVWLDTSCCEGPITNESRTWSEVKAMYR
ncbi:hypothetical protein H8E07_08535 [bacterium]|nr:hypothetical protein [bacterium]